MFFLRAEMFFPFRILQKSKQTDRSNRNWREKELKGETEREKYCTRNAERKKKDIVVNALKNPFIFF